jgi:hypothetical protein
MTTDIRRDTVHDGAAIRLIKNYVEECSQFLSPWTALGDVRETAN